MIIRILLFLIFAVMSTNTFSQQLDPCPGHLVTIEPGGAVSSGSKEALFKAVRSGLPIRVGWSLDFNKDGKAELAHWADAMFLTEFENEVFAQIPEINKQAPMRGKARIDLGDKSLRWSGIVGTNGVLEGRFNDDQPATQFPVKSQWCIDSRVPQSVFAAKSEQANAADCHSSWRLVYHNDKDGKQISGSKDDLFNAIRRGYPMRLAWGTSAEKGELKISVEHAAEPVFISIMNGNDLAVQIPEHIGQKSYWDSKQSKFDKPEVMWRGLLSTTGTFDAVFVNRANGEIVKRIPQQARVAWYVFAPPSTCESASAPVLAVPQGVTLSDQSS